MTAATRLWRCGAVASFCGLPLLLAALAVGNLIEASTSRELAARQDATAALIVKEVAKRQTRNPQPQDAAAFFLPVASASLARAALQERAGHFVEVAGGRLEEAQFTSTAEQEAEGIVAIQLSFTIGNEGLRDLLYAIETATPLLEIVELSAKPADGLPAASQGQVQQGQAQQGQAHRLHVELMVEGYFKKGTG